MNWISVDDELPSNNQSGDFLVFVKDGKTNYQAIYSFGIYGEEKWSFLGVTHWMPLPEPPSCP